MVKIVFLGTPQFSVPALESLVKNTNVALVITQPDRPVGRGYEVLPTPIKISAEKNGIPIMQPDNVNSIDILETVKDIEPDFIVVVAYGQILKKPWLSIAKKEILNLHASLLPKYRGASPIQSAILEGDEETGVSIMGVRSKMDTGPVYLERKIHVGDKNCHELSSELAEIGAEALRETILHFSSYKPLEQIEKNATYCKKITRDDGRVIFKDMDSVEIYRMYKAFSGWPSVYAHVDGKRLIFTEIKMADVDFKALPGEVVNENGKVYIRAKDGFIEVVKVKPEGKREMSISDFLRGIKGMPRLN